MNGSRYLLDTNAIVTLLRGNSKLLHKLEVAEWVGISVISQIEFLAFSGLTDKDRAAFSRFLSRVLIVALSGDQTSFINLIVKVRRDNRLKLPDAIIAATSMWNDATLVTADAGFRNVEKLKVLWLG